MTALTQPLAVAITRVGQNLGDDELFDERIRIVRLGNDLGYAVLDVLFVCGGAQDLATYERAAWIAHRVDPEAFLTSGLVDRQLLDQTATVVRMRIVRI